MKKLLVCAILNFMSIFMHGAVSPISVKSPSLQALDALCLEDIDKAMHDTVLRAKDTCQQLLDPEEYVKKLSTRDREYLTFVALEKRSKGQPLDKVEDGLLRQYDQELYGDVLSESSDVNASSTK